DCPDYSLALRRAKPDMKTRRRPTRRDSYGFRINDAHKTGLETGEDISPAVFFASSRVPQLPRIKPPRGEGNVVYDKSQPNTPSHRVRARLLCVFITNASTEYTSGDNV